jgi:nitrite reductase/ring-hydroxylating ferredoxin subunit
MSFVKVATAKDLEPGKMMGMKASGKSILVANVKGTYYAIGNVCTHMGCLLSDGDLEGETVTCSCHGSKFDIKTGKVVGGPATTPESSYEVKVEKDQIMVNV